MDRYLRPSGMSRLVARSDDGGDYIQLIYHNIRMNDCKSMFIKVRHEASKHDQEEIHQIRTVKALNSI
jgi:hypothetical protein